MASTEKNSDPLKNLTRDQLKDIVKSNDALEQEEKRWIEEQRAESQRKAFEKKSAKTPFKRLRKPPLEIISRSLFFVFLGSFLLSFISVYSANPLWFFWYVISAFVCILYTPNRKALKELLDAWPNILDLIKSRRK